MTLTNEQFARILEMHVRPATYPVAVKRAVAGETIPQKPRSPLSHMGRPIAVCQGLNIVRTIGWTLDFGPGDHGCPVGAVVAGHIPPDRFLEGRVAGLYQDDPEAAEIMEAGYPRLQVGAITGLWMSPLARCRFDPDLVVVYGNPAQMVVLIHAANYGRGTGIRSVSSGRVGCSAWIAGAGDGDACTYAIPGSGERVFGGTQDHEMAFLIPRSACQGLAEGLAAMRKKGSYRYPVPNMHLLEKPRLPDVYEELEGE